MFNVHNIFIYINRDLKTPFMHAFSALQLCFQSDYLGWILGWSTKISISKTYGNAENSWVKGAFKRIKDLVFLNE